MSDIQRRSSNRPTRRQREQRAYNLVLASGALALITVVAVVLAVVGAIGFGLPVVTAILAVVAWLLFRRTVGGG
jgi:hypothetical protein